MDISNEKESDDDTLLDLGWCQGAIFYVEGVKFTYNDISHESNSVALLERVIKSKERLVLITQDCDIVSKSEKYVEAMICIPDRNDKRLEMIDKNSARWFVLDYSERLIVEAKYRISLTKESLKGITPEMFPSPERLERFRGWLARRYDRPAIPDELVHNFQRPLEALFVSIADESPTKLEVFNKYVHSLRILQPANDNVPHDITLVILLERGISEFDSDDFDAFDDVIKRIETNFDREKVNIVGIKLLTEDEISVKDFRQTVPIYLDYFSYGGEYMIGATPIRLTG